MTAPANPTSASGTQVSCLTPGGVGAIVFTEIGLSGTLSDLPVSVWVALAPTLTIFDVQREAGGWQDPLFCCRRVLFKQ